MVESKSLPSEWGKGQCTCILLSLSRKKKLFFFSILDDSHYVHTNVHITWLK